MLSGAPWSAEEEEAAYGGSDDESALPDRTPSMTRWRSSRASARSTGSSGASSVPSGLPPPRPRRARSVNTASSRYSRASTSASAPPAAATLAPSRRAPRASVLARRLLPHLGRGREAVAAMRLALDMIGPHEAHSPCPSIQDVATRLEALAFSVGPRTSATGDSYTSGTVVPLSGTGVGGHGEAEHGSAISWTTDGTAPAAKVCTG